MRISTLCNICYIVVSRELLLYVFLQKLLHCLNKFKNRHRAVCRCRFVSDSWASCLLLVTSASDLLVHTIRLCSVVFGVTSSLAVIHTIYRRLSSVVFVIVYSERARLVAVAPKNHGDGDFIARGAWWSNTRSVRPAIYCKCHNLRDGGRRRGDWKCGSGKCGSR